MEPVEILHRRRRRTGCSRWRSGCPCRRGGVFAVTIGSKSGSKNIGASRDSSWSSDSPFCVGNTAPDAAAARAASANASSVHVEDELARRQVVVRAGVDPEQLRVALRSPRVAGAATSAGCVRIASSTSRISRLWRVALVVVDVAPGERRLIEMPDERLLLERQCARSRPRTPARRPHRRPARADSAGPFAPRGHGRLLLTAAGCRIDRGHDESNPLFMGGTRSLPAGLDVEGKTAGLRCEGVWDVFRRFSSRFEP